MASTIAKTNANDAQKRWLPAVAILLIGVATWIFFRTFAAVEWEKGIDIGGTAQELALSLGIIAAFLERAMATINYITYSSVRKKIEATIRSALRTPGGPPDDASPRPTMQELRLELAKVDADETEVRTIGSLMMGLLISAAGVRTLDIFFALPANSTQANLFRVVDIILTAGLLAGGTAGINKLVKLLSEIIDRLRDKLRTDR